MKQNLPTSPMFCDSIQEKILLNAPLTVQEQWHYLHCPECQKFAAINSSLSDSPSSAGPSRKTEYAIFCQWEQIPRKQPLFTLFALRNCKLRLWAKIVSTAAVLVLLLLLWQSVPPNPISRPIPTVRAAHTGGAPRFGEIEQSSLDITLLAAEEQYQEMECLIASILP